MYSSWEGEETWPLGRETLWMGKEDDEGKARIVMVGRANRRAETLQKTGVESEI